jgi:hypothetical protein
MMEKYVDEKERLKGLSADELRLELHKKNELKNLFRGEEDSGPKDFFPVIVKAS